MRGQVQAAAKAYRVYYTKTNDDPQDYLVDHSIIMYLLDPAGQFVAFYGKNYTAEELAAAIGKAVTGGGR
jgi:protein SCO1/2